jgi:hypothetical protein
MERTDSFAFSFPEGDENRGVAAIELGQARLHRSLALNCSNPSPKTKNPTPNVVGLFAGSMELNLYYLSS